MTETFHIQWHEEYYLWVGPDPDRLYLRHWDCCFIDVQQTRLVSYYWPRGGTQKDGQCFLTNPTLLALFHCSTPLNVLVDAFLESGELLPPMQTLLESLPWT